jgi:hypothetical protein
MALVSRKCPRCEVDSHEVLGVWLDRWALCHQCRVRWDLGKTSTPAGNAITWRANEARLNDYEEVAP